MKHTKKITALLLAGAMTLSVCACSDEAGSTGPKPKPAIENVYALEVPALPDMAPYPDEESFIKSDGMFDSEGYDAVYTAWSESRQAQREQASAYTGKLNEYLKKTAAAYLTPTEAGDNAACSPLNIWMALAIAAETAGGSTRQELLDLLGMSSIEETRAVAKALWNANYCDDGACTSRMAASLWMNKDVPFKEAVLKTLAEEYLAGSYQGDMADPAFSKAFKDWLNENTGGLLSDAVDNLDDFDPETVMALATTVYFSAKWTDRFQEDNTYTETFHGAKNDADADFMLRTESGQYYWTEHFGAVNLPFEDAGSMWLILPDEGVDPASLLADGSAMDFLLGSYDAREKNSKHVMIDMAVPKFDVSAEMDLQKTLESLGVSEMFSRQADFSNLTDLEGVFIGSASHNARVKVDEEGCEAAAFTVMMYCGAAMPPDEHVEFKLDRPFLFALTGTDGLPLFYGIVNQL